MPAVVCPSMNTVETPADEADSLLGDGAVDVDVSDTMSRYTQAITKFNK